MERTLAYRMRGTTQRCRSKVRSKSTRCGLLIASMRFFFSTQSDKKLRAMNFKNIFMGLAAWFVLGFALHGSDEKEGQLGFEKDTKTTDAMHKKVKALLEADDKT